MPVQSKKYIQDKHNEKRWEVIGPAHDWRGLCQLEVFIVQEQKPELKRNLYLLTLNNKYWSKELDSMDREDLHHSFMGMVNILCANYTFLPEPLELLDIPEKNGQKQPCLIVAQHPGLKFYDLTRQKHTKKLFLLKQNAFACLNTLGSLHFQKAVIQALPMNSLALSPVTFKPYFYGVETLIKMKDFKGYNQNKICLRPDPVFAAPECFNPQGNLTPATDIYALGKLLIRLLLTQKDFDKVINKKDPFPQDMQNLINNLGLDQFWERFLAFCLQPEQKRRFQNVFEAKAYLSGGMAKYTEAKENQQNKNHKNRKYNHAGKLHNKKQAGKPPWSYKQNPQLPPAALLIWNPGLTQYNEHFDFFKIYIENLYTYNLQPRLFFDWTKNEKRPPDNPFYDILKNKFSLNIVLYSNKDANLQARLLCSHLKPESIERLILVSTGNNLTINKLLELPVAKNWDITWVRKGKGRAPFPIRNIIDGNLYISKKRGR